MYKLKLRRIRTDSSKNFIMLIGLFISVLQYVLPVVHLLGKHSLMFRKYVPFLFYFIVSAE